MRYILLLALLCSTATAQTSKMTDFTEATVVDSDDIFWSTIDTAGTPLDRKVTLGTLQSKTGIPVYNVTDAKYGAISGDGIDDLAAFQAAVDAMAAAGGGELIVPRGTYHLTGSVDISECTAEKKTFIFRGIGRPTITALNNITGFFFDKEITGTSDPNINKRPVIIFDNFQFVDGGFTHGGAIKIQRMKRGGCRNIHIDGSEDFGFGIDLQFCLECFVDWSNLFGTTNALRVTYGQWSGGTGTNSASNVFSSRNIRVEGNGPFTSGTGGPSILVKGVSGSIFWNLACEGSEPSSYDIEFDTDAVTTVHNLGRIIGIHVEHPDDANDYMDGCIHFTGAQAATSSVSDINTFANQAPLIVNDALDVSVVVTGVRQAGANIFEDSGTNAWTFINWNESVGPPTDEYFWVGNDLPNVQTGTGRITSGDCAVGTLDSDDNDSSLALLSNEGVFINGGQLCLFKESEATEGTYSGNSGYCRLVVNMDGNEVIGSTGLGSATNPGALCHWEFIQDGTGGRTITENTSTVIDPYHVLHGLNLDISTKNNIYGIYDGDFDKVVLQRAVSGYDGSTTNSSHGKQMWMRKRETTADSTITFATSDFNHQFGDSCELRWEITQDGSGGDGVSASGSVIDPNSLLTGYDTTATTVGVIYAQYNETLGKAIITFVASGL